MRITEIFLLAVLSSSAAKKIARDNAAKLLHLEELPAATDP